MNYCPIKKFNLGIANNFESSSAYADAILSIYNLNKEEYNLLCENAIEAAKHYDYQVLTNRFVAALKTI
jgi:hypothetical protein